MSDKADASAAVNAYFDKFHPAGPLGSHFLVCLWIAGFKVVPLTNADEGQFRNFYNGVSYADEVLRQHPPGS